MEEKMWVLSLKNKTWFEQKANKKQQKNKPKQPKLQSGREERHKTPNTSLTMEDTLLLFFKASLNISTLGRNQMQNICIFKFASIYLNHSNLIQLRYTPRRSTVTAFPIPTHQHSVSVMITHTGLSLPEQVGYSCLCLLYKLRGITAG